jgi:hypothetical protein
VVFRFGCCSFCGRILSVASDLLSGDCGGDCWGCVGKIEADAGYAPSIACIRKEIENGWRLPDGTAKLTADIESSPLNVLYRLRLMSFCS